MKPFSPAELKEKFNVSFDPIMIEAVNKLLVKNYSPLRNTITIKQKDIISEYMIVYAAENHLDNIFPPDEEKIKLKREELFATHQLDFEQIFIKEGWDVRYDKADYRESYYEPYYTFTDKSEKK